MLREDYIPFDVASFSAFLQSKPSLAALQAAFPTLTIVEPGSVTTTEMRHGGNRFFPIMEGTTVVGGAFR